MDYLFDVWKGVEKLISKSDRVLLLLDYDGTITPIVERPELAILPEKTRELLQSISKSPKYTLCIVSGRPLEDVKKLVGIKGVYYIGNHGLEADGPKVSYINPDAIKAKPVIDELSQKLKDRLKHIKGILIEHKNITLAVHYRRVHASEVPKVKDIFTKTVEPYLKEGSIKTTKNKKTLEILPKVDWDKGKMIREILNLLSHAMLLPKIEWSPVYGMTMVPIFADLNILLVYIGDDNTDEDAFKILGSKGVSVLVSEQIRRSYARYYVKNVDEVIKTLNLFKDYNG